MKRDRLAHLRLPPIKRRERPFEARLRDRLKVYGVLFVKSKPTIKGFPDRIAIGFGRIGLVELKSQDGKLDESQIIFHHNVWRLHQVKILVVDSGMGIDGASKRVIRFLQKLPV